MNISDFRKRLQRVKSDLIDALPKIGEEIAVSTLSMIKNRSIEEGIIIDGQEGSEKDYSTNEVYTSSFKKKTLNSGGTSYIQSNKKGTWAGFRKAQGLPANKVNLSYTNRMWTGLQVIRSTTSGQGKCQTVIGAVDQETRDKLAGNTERYGDFLQPTPEELKIAQEVARDRLNQIIQSR